MNCPIHFFVYLDISKVVIVIFIYEWNSSLFTLLSVSRQIIFLISKNVGKHNYKLYFLSLMYLNFIWHGLEDIYYFKDAEEDTWLYRDWVNNFLTKESQL